MVQRNKPGGMTVLRETCESVGRLFHNKLILK